MDSEKQLAHGQQLILCSQTKSDAYFVTPSKQTTNYKPNIWKFDFIQSLHSKYKEEEYRSQAAKLNDGVKKMFLEAVDILAKLELVDRICKLGLSILFEEQIHGALDTISAFIKRDTSSLEEDLYATALCFKLLRKHGFEISQDMFISFMDEKGTFLKGKCADIKGLIELFEASHVALEGESFLDEAKVFSREALKGIYYSLNSTDQLARKVARVLELSSHRRVPWYETRWQINSYEKENDVNKVLFELAKLNFNMVQATLQYDLKELSRWWRNLGMIENLSFSRDRLVESFMCAVGLVHEPELSCFRKWLTKVIIFILVIDDIYDIYGSLEELQHFTNAVDRWDSREIQHLPESMKISFQALYETTNEMANQIQNDKGWSRVLPHLRKAWADFCKALLVEAKWQKKGYTPSLQEYLSNAWITSSGPLLSVFSLFSIMNKVNEEEPADFFDLNKDLIYNSSLIIRLCNDLGTSAAELERGDVASSILCYMLEKNVSEEIARNYVKGMISETWTKINGQCFTQSPFLRPFIRIITNFARVAHSLYQYGDGFGVQDRETKKQILSLLIEPMSLAS